MVTGAGQLDRLRIEVDEVACVGGGQCVLAADDIFDQRDDDGVVIVLDATPGRERLEAVRRAVRLCPANAIRVIE
jgi:ferredoxin